MTLFNKLKTKAESLKKELTAIYYAYTNPGTPVLPKIIIALTLGYALSPIDLIPDFIPFFGYLDDLIIIPALISLSIKLIPREIMADSREKASHKPLQLKKNWLFAILFIVIWIVLLMLLIKTAIE